MPYSNSSSFSDLDRTGGAFHAPTQPQHNHDAENLPTLRQFSSRPMHGKGTESRSLGAAHSHRSRLAFGKLNNNSILFSDAQMRKHGGGNGGSGGSGFGDAKLHTQIRGEPTHTSPKVRQVSGDDSRRVTSARPGGPGSDGSGMDWDAATSDGAAAMHDANRRRTGSIIDASPSPRTPTVESPNEGEGHAARVATDDDDVTPLPQPGALTIQRLNLHRQSRMMGLDERDLDREMEEQHRRQHAAMHEGPMARLLLWRDPARTALCFSAGVVLLVAARAPDLVAARFPVNPVVMAAYAAMAYLCRAYVLAAAFSRRNHGLTVDVEGAADFARWCAGCANAVTHAHGDLLSGRSNGAVLRAFLGLYVIACLGGLLNSTWGVTCVLWAAAFTATPAVDAKRQSIAAATAWFSTEVGGRWAARSSNQRWGVSAAVLAVVFVASPLFTRLVLVFVTLVALRLYRETHLKQVESFERAMKDAGRRLSRAGSEFHAMVGSPAQMFYRRRAAANNSHGMSTLGRGGTHSGISWNN
jgi:hypothetical protein